MRKVKADGQDRTGYLAELNNSLLTLLPKDKQQNITDFLTSGQFLSYEKSRLRKQYIQTFSPICNYIMTQYQYVSGSMKMQGHYRQFYQSGPTLFLSSATEDTRVVTSSHLDLVKYILLLLLFVKSNCGKKKTTISELKKKKKMKCSIKRTPLFSGPVLRQTYGTT